MSKRNNSAQIHVLEVIIVAGMLLMSLYFVRTFEFSPNIKTTDENELEILSEGILKSLEGVPDSEEHYPSLLARYLTTPYRNDDETFPYKENFVSYVERSIPEGTLFEILRVNITKLKENPDLSIRNDHITKYVNKIEVKVGTEASSSRIVVIDNTIYEVVLTLYLTLG